MASAIIHLAIANEIKKNFKVDNEKDYLLGSIAPDISKQIGKNRDISHFITNTNEPNINLFINKYPNFKRNSFNLGYFIHLYTDILWNKIFLNEIINKDNIRLLDGTIIKTTEEETLRMIYSDYTNLNIKIIEEYNLDLSLFYEEFSIPKTHLTEIPIENLDILLDKMGIIIENSKESKPYTFDFEKIDNFIKESIQIITRELKKYY